MSSLLAAQQSLVTLITQFVDATFNTESGTWTRGMLESRLELLRSYWNRLQSNHLELVGKGRLAGDPYFTETIYEHTESAVLGAFSHIHDERARLDSTQLEVQRPVPVVHQLPRVNLPNFNGAQKDWEPFRDLYIALVHTNSSLSDVQKLCYLKAALQGEAKAALDSVSVTDANYQTAWRLLLRRHLDRPVEHWNDWFVFLAARGMDSRTLRDWEHELRGEDRISIFSDVQSFLQRKVWVLKATETSSAEKSHTSSQNSQTQKSNSRGSTRLMAVSPSKGSCSLCGEQHYVGHCGEFKKQKPEQRIKAVTQLKLCYNCLRNGHVAQQCSSKSKAKCFVCHRSAV